MSKASQGRLTPDGSMRPKGVVVEFPSARVCSPELPLPDGDGWHLDLITPWIQPEDEWTTSNGGVMRSDIDPQGDFSSAEKDPESHHPERPAATEAPEKPGNPIQPRKSWLQRWLFPDRAGQDKRSVARELTPGLIARFWTGGPPQAHPVRDISATGMYVVTEERWYLGTQILITLTKPPEGESRTQLSITVVATAVRWGDDGVGLEFILEDARNRRQQKALLADGAKSEQLEQFMDDLRAGSDGSITPSVPNRRKR